MKLSSELKFRKEVQKVCLPPRETTDLFSDVPVTVAGWGTMSGKKKKMPNKLQKVVLKTLPNSECAAGEFSKPGYPDISLQMICATSIGQYSCYGDSGGE